MLKKILLGLLGVFFAANSFANPNSHRHHNHHHNHSHYNRHLDRDLAIIAGSAIIGGLIYNSVNGAPYTPPVVVERPIVVEPQRQYYYNRPYYYENRQPYYEMRWVYFPGCNCYRYVETYR